MCYGEVDGTPKMSKPNMLSILNHNLTANLTDPNSKYNSTRQSMQEKLKGVTDFTKKNVGELELDAKFDDKTNTRESH